MGQIESLMSVDVDPKIHTMSYNIEDGKCTFSGFIFTLARNHRDPFKDFINSFQKENNCRVTKIDAIKISENNYLLRSLEFTKEDSSPCTGISTSMYNDMNQVHICEYWYLNYN